MAVPGRPVRVLVVDDSAVVRQLLQALLGEDPMIEVVGTAADPYIAREKIKRLAPDVLTLDIEMPRMDGLSFLRNLMRLRPMPVVMVSTLTEHGAPTTLEALSLGAVDFFAKPQAATPAELEIYAADLRARIHQAAASVVDHPAPARRPAPAAGGSDSRVGLIAIGASTGGTEAIRQVLEALPADGPPVVIAQHIPATFSAAFAERLDRLCPMAVRHAGLDQPLLHGHAYLAPGGRQMEVYRRGGELRCRTREDDGSRLHRPSVDALFASVARHAGADAAAALLTGMGKDGALGLLALRTAGAFTVAQDAATSVVWGMPGAAVALDAACRVAPLHDFAGLLLGRGAELAPALPVAVPG